MFALISGIFGKLVKNKVSIFIKQIRGRSDDIQQEVKHPPTVLQHENGD